MNIVEKLRLMQTDHIPELGEAISEIEHLRREVHAWSKACEDATTKLYKPQPVIAQGRVRRAVPRLPARRA